MAATQEDFSVIIPNYMCIWTGHWLNFPLNFMSLSLKLLSSEAVDDDRDADDGR